MRSDVIDAPGARGLRGSALAVLFLLGFVLLVAGGPFRTVPAGHVGVQDFFGSVSMMPRPAGLSPARQPRLVL